MHFYSISRRDLPVHQQAIQSAHSQLEYCRKFRPPEGEHPSFVWLTVENKEELLHLSSVLSFNHIDVAQFQDPDYEGYDPSAIACLVPEHRRHLLLSYPLWKCESTQKNKGLLEWITSWKHLAKVF